MECEVSNRVVGHLGLVRSKARNPLVAQNLREFPLPPNIDDGEGVRMMFG